MIKKGIIKQDGSGSIDFDEFLVVYSKLIASNSPSGPVCLFILFYYFFFILFFIFFLFFFLFYSFFKIILLSFYHILRQNTSSTDLKNTVLINIVQIRKNQQEISQQRKKNLLLFTNLFLFLFSYSFPFSVPSFFRLSFVFLILYYFSIITGPRITRRHGTPRHGPSRHGRPWRGCSQEKIKELNPF